MIYEKAYNKLVEIYGENIDFRILNRFYTEKMLIGNGDYLRQIELVGELQKEARVSHQSLFVRGTLGSLLIAYLLGASEINPLPCHSYCPSCKTIHFTKRKITSELCSCGAKTEYIGYDIPLEANISSFNFVALSVPFWFYLKAEAMIREYWSDRKIVTLKDEIGATRAKLVVLPDDGTGDIELSFAEGEQKYKQYPAISLIPYKTLDLCKELEYKTTVPFGEVPIEDARVIAKLCSGDFKGMPHFDNDFMSKLVGIVSPKTSDDLLKMIGFSTGTDIWLRNGELYNEEKALEISEIPAFCEDIFTMISTKLHELGIYEIGFAHEVMRKTKIGYYARYGIDKLTRATLLSLGFDIIFCDFLESINYMFPKAHAVEFLHQIQRLTWYKIHYPEAFGKVFQSDD